MKTTTLPPAFKKIPFSDPWFYALAALFLLLVIFSIRRITDIDIGYHLRSGQWIAENHRMLRNEIFTFTVSDHDYLDVYWLFQVSLYLFFLVGGYGFLTLLNACLIFTAFFLLFKRSRDAGAPLWVCVPLLTAALLASESRFQVRPEIPSWILLNLTLWVLELRAARGRNLLFLLPLIQLAWVNLHGLFILGWGVMGFYLASQFLHSRKLDKKLFQYTALSLACCFLNPNFLKGVLYPISSFNLLRSAGLIKQSISELQSPWTMAAQDSLLPQLAPLAYKGFSFLLLFLLLATFRKRKINDFLLAGVFFYLSATALRNVSLFMMVSVPIAAACAKDLKWDWPARLQGSPSLKRAAAFSFILLFLGLSARVATNAYYVSGRGFDRFGLGLEEEQLPVRAAEFLVKNRLDGKIFNQVNAGSWLVWKGPQKVFINGHMEVMGEEFLGEYKSSNTQAGLEALLGKYKIDIIFFKPSDAPNWVLELQKMPDWRAAYLDETAVVYLREGYSPQTPGIHFNRLLAERNLSPVSPGEAQRALQAPRISKWVGFWRGFYGPTTFPKGLLNLADFNSYNEHPEVAEPLYLEAIRRSRGEFDECYLNLGAMYHYKKRYEEAGLCMRRVLEQSPDNRLALKILADISSQ